MRENRLKSGILVGGPVSAKFSHKRARPHQSFLYTIDRRTGAPQKGTPTKGAAHFCMPEIIGDPRGVASL